MGYVSDFFRRLKPRGFFSDERKPAHKFMPKMLPWKFRYLGLSESGAKERRDEIVKRKPRPFFLRILPEIFIVILLGFGCFALYHFVLKSSNFDMKPGKDIKEYVERNAFVEKWKTQGNIHLEEGNYKGAITAFSKVIETETYDITSERGLLIALEKMCKKELQMCDEYKAQKRRFNELVQ